MEMRIYFSHPIKTYATPEALEVLKALKEEYPGSTIVDPEDYDVPKYSTCEQCRSEVMEDNLFPLIEECDIFAIWAPIAPCRIGCELHHAWHEEKLCIYLSYEYGEVEFEPVTLRDYHYMRVATEGV